MIKNRLYAMYKGNEYEVDEDMNDNLIIMTEDISLIDKDFEDTYNSGLFTKNIEIEDLSILFEIRTRAKYENEIFEIKGEDEKMYCLSTLDANVARKLKMMRDDKYSYNLWILKDKVLLIEEKKQIQLKYK